MAEIFQSYSRADAIRILRIRHAQLQRWERTGLIVARENYGFADLVQLRTLRDLSARRVRPAVIRASVEAMQKQVAGMVNPLVEADAATDGARILFRHAGTVMEPVRGQFVLDFPPGDRQRSGLQVLAPRRTPGVADLFAQAVALEEGGRILDALHLYQRIVDADPLHAAAWINLGTLCYNHRQFARAEQCYRRATSADPGYALAWFDLGNVLDELRRVPEAIGAYRTAVELSPRYADAHYNLALAYEQTGLPRRALRHWRAYLKLDPASRWAEHARSQVRRTLEQESLRIVARNPMPRR